MILSSPDRKEETMKKFICITFALMLMSILIGCSAGMAPEERKELYTERKGSDLRGTVGYQPFVGGNSLDSRGLMISVY